MSASTNNPPIACNLNAIGAGDLARYKQLVAKLRAAIDGLKELPDGYQFSLDSAKATLPEVAEWIGLERLCCPFLSFQLDVQGNGESRLTLRGPDGTKSILRQEFAG